LDEHSILTRVAKDGCEGARVVLACRHTNRAARQEERERDLRGDRDGLGIGLILPDDKLGGSLVLINDEANDLTVGEERSPNPINRTTPDLNACIIAADQIGAAAANVDGVGSDAPDGHRVPINDNALADGRKDLGASSMEKGSTEKGAVGGGNVDEIQRRGRLDLVAKH